MDHILYQIFKIILRDKPGENTDNPSLMIYINKMENRITFKRKAEYYLELLPPETMKLLRSNKSKINKDANGKNVPNLEITELLFVHCNIIHKKGRQLLTI